MSQFIQVVDETADEIIEIPSEDDGTLLLTTLSAQFPAACGLKYKSETGAYRGIRLADGVLYPPDGIWGNHQYLAVFPKTDQKRKGENGMDDNPAKKRPAESKVSDLIVLGLPWKSSEDDLKKYFGQFGDLVLAQVKRDIRTGQSKGFGFIRFAEPDSQVKCMSQRHMIDGRWCDVTFPNSKENPNMNNFNNMFQSEWQQPVAKNEGQNSTMNRKVFIGRCTENISAEDLRNYFSQFGEVVDVFIPKPFRAFAFVTFADAEVAQSLCGDDHIIQGTSVHISNAAPKSGGAEKQQGQGMGRGFGGFGQAGFGAGGFGRGSSGGGQAGKGDGPAGPLGMNLLNSAMLAAAQAMLSGQGGNFNMAAAGQQAGHSGTDGQQQQGVSSHGFGGGMGGGQQSSGGGGGGSSWWGSTDSTTPAGGAGSYSGWGGRSGGWN
ncbi:hypothetical protein ACOMHN_050287 [Nucella lapillus]